MSPISHFSFPISHFPFPISQAAEATVEWLWERACYQSEQKFVMKWMIRPVVKRMVEVAMLWTAKEAASSAVRVKLSIIVYTLYTPFIHLYSRTYTFVHPLYMYIRPYIHRTHLLTPSIRPEYALTTPLNHLLLNRYTTASNSASPSVQRKPPVIP